MHQNVSVYSLHRYIRYIIATNPSNLCSKISISTSCFQFLIFNRRIVNTHLFDASISIARIFHRVLDFHPFFFTLVEYLRSVIRNEFRWQFSFSHPFSFVLIFELIYVFVYLIMRLHCPGLINMTIIWVDIFQNFTSGITRLEMLRRVARRIS